jgi:hypothetical protein
MIDRLPSLNGDETADHEAVRLAVYQAADAEEAAQQARAREASALAKLAIQRERAERAESELDKLQAAVVERDRAIHRAGQAEQKAAMLEQVIDSLKWEAGEAARRRQMEMAERQAADPHHGHRGRRKDPEREEDKRRAREEQWAARQAELNKPLPSIGR